MAKTARGATGSWGLKQPRSRIHSTENDEGFRKTLKTVFGFIDRLKKKKKRITARRPSIVAGVRG